MFRVFIKSANFGITILLLLAGIFLVYIATPIFGNKALIVRSGSMEPTIKTGDVAVIHKKNSLLSPVPFKNPLYNEGDIIAFEREKNSKVITTHRIIGKETKDNKVFYRTKGDANDTVDQSIVSEERIIGSSQFIVPGIGKLFAFAKTRNGFLLMIILPALLVIAHEIMTIIREIRKFKQRTRDENTPSAADYFRPTPINSISLRILLPLILSTMFFHNSFAFYSDSETSVDNVLQASDQFPGINDIVINEVYYRIALAHRIGSEADSEWAELYNPTNISVSLESWSISDNTSCDNMPNASISSHGFAIVSTHTEAEFRAVWTTIPTDGSVVFVTSPSAIGNGLANNDELALRSGVCPSGPIVDHISWGSNIAGLNPSIPAAGSAGISHERDPDGVDTDTNTDFIDRNPPTPGS